MKVQRVRQGLVFSEELPRLGRKLKEGTRSKLLDQLEEAEDLYGLYQDEDEKIAHFLGRYLDKIKPEGYHPLFGTTQRDVRYFAKKMVLLGYYALGKEAKKEIFEEVDIEKETSSKEG